MQVICWGAPEAPKAGCAKGTAETSALEETVLPQEVRKESVLNIKALTLTMLLEEVMGNTTESCLVVYGVP